MKSFLLMYFIMDDNIKHIISDIPIYWINLDRSIERRNRLEKFLNDNNLQNKRIEAIDGKKIDIDEIKKEYIIKRMRKDQLPSAIGCTLSHIKAINTAYNDNVEFALIIEDDCNFEYLKYKDIPLKELIKKKDDWEIIMLSLIASKKRNSEISEYKNDLIKIFCWGTGAYLINRLGMKKVLENFEKKKIMQVADILIYEDINKYVSIPYFTYYFSNDIKSCIREEKKKVTFEDKSKIFWDNFYGIKR